MADKGDGGGSNTIDCKKYPQYCNGDKPKTADELLKMRDKKKDKNNGTVISGVPAGSCSGPGCLLESGVPYGPGCVYTNYCYVVPEEPEPLPWAPDYFVLDVGGGLIGILGVDVQPIVFDKYGRFYLGIGPGVGTSPAFGWKVNGSWSGGYILDSNTTKGEVRSFLSKWTVTGCVGVAAGVCGAWGDPGLTKSNGELKDFAIQVGAFTPQLGVSATYGFPLSDQ
jgi:hypothetical protein